MKSELERLCEGASVEAPDGAIVVILAGASDASESLNRVKEVLRCFAEERDESEPWPSDEEWLQRLPDWFTSTFEQRTIAELLADKNLWDCGSWLDAMRYRGWEWWSSSCDPGKGSWTAVLVQREMVYAIDPLVYLARVSGASSVEVTEQ